MQKQGLYVGLMSGTSLDSIDAVVIQTDGAQAKLLASHSHPIENALRHRLLALAESPTTTLEEVGEVDRELGIQFACAVRDLLSLAAIPAIRIVAIGSHGQTIRHRPARSGPSRGFTLQIGDPNTIAEMTGICTVADFRRRDVAAGGQGAPLVPAFHQAVFGSPGVDRVVANIGGMSNISVLPESGSDATGFDTGPGNALMDAWTTLHLGLPFDADGDWASSGKADMALLSALLRHPFLSLPPPKSTGREEFNLPWLERALGELGRRLEPQDVQATLLELTARTLIAGIMDAMPTCTEIYLCGGGARNVTLVDKLAQLLPGRTVATTEHLGVHPDWVEACAFAWLGHQSLIGSPGNLPSVTGATRRVILGGVYPGHPR
jgi:anhydro-N-acetylmuramic acid kinase